MKLRTLLSLLFSGQIKVMRSLSRAAHDYHWVAFLGGGQSNGVLAAVGGRSLGKPRYSRGRRY